MLSYSYYLVSANNKLKNWLKNRETEVANFLRQDYMICNQESGCSSWLPSDYLAKVKLLYLGYLSVDISSSEEFKQLIGNNPISLELFDKWWNITPIEADESDFIENQITQQSRHLSFSKTGLPVVDEWFKWLTHSKLSRDGTTPA
jgi:hypothetical protein